MKKYYEFMNEITAEELYEGLLGYGMFNEQLPPIFSSKQFLNYCLLYNPTFNNTKREQSYIYYESMRNINIPRELGIPNPMAYEKLCLHLKDNWDKIEEHFKENTKKLEHKISRIHLRKKDNTKKLFNMNYKNFKKDGTPETEFLLGSKYLVEADISKFYSSIYTHSLSWALVGKEEAKNNKNDKSKWYNKLDFYVRNTTHGETHGILIGPNTSNILSEIILTAIDFELYKKGWKKYVRNIDDYNCYVSSYEEGQRFLIDLSKELRKYKLTFNHKKTKIINLPMASTEKWVRKLNSYTKLTDKKIMNYKDIQAYLDLAIDLMQNNNNTAIMNYTIKVLAKKRMTENAILYYIKVILHLTAIYPYLITLIEKYVFKNFNVNQATIIDFSNVIYDEGIKSSNYELVSFSIYYSLIYNFKLENINFNDIKKSNHCILLLLGYLYSENNELRQEIKELKRLARKLVVNEDEFNEYWLFIYESLPKSSLKSDWKDLKEKGVSFVKSF